MKAILRQRIINIVSELYKDNFDTDLKDHSVISEEEYPDETEFFYLDLDDLLESGNFPRDIVHINDIIDYLIKHTHEELVTETESELVRKKKQADTHSEYEKQANSEPCATSTGTGRKISDKVPDLLSVTTQTKTSIRPLFILLTIFILGLMGRSGWLYFQNKPWTAFYESPFMLLFGAFGLLFIAIEFRRSYIQLYMDLKKIVVKDKLTQKESIYPMTDIKGYHDSFVWRKNRQSLGVLILKLQSGKKIYIHESKYSNYEDIRSFLVFDSCLSYLGEKFFYWW
jgi:hypothetical protein